jgi:hypothetical protein
MKTRYSTGEKCPKEGFWRQIETGDIVWHTTEDFFPPRPLGFKNAVHYEFVSDDANGDPKQP